MPELPEVETVVRLLRPDFEGREVRAVHVSWPRTVGELGVARFRRAVVGTRVARLWRRAKYVVGDLERGGAPAGVLVGHLRMTGRMHVEDPDVVPNPYTRASLELDDGRVFHFVDVRKFGRLTWSRELDDALPPLGPEPLGDAFTADWFARAVRARRRQLKPLLLDQSFVAGLGNIYVDESLFRARLHPLESSDRVGPQRARRLHAAIREVLAEAIEREGSSFDTFYRTPEGQPGSYQDQFQVYGRTGRDCLRCGQPVRRIVVGQRGTHFCSRCQRRSRPKTARLPAP